MFEDRPGRIKARHRAPGSEDRPVRIKARHRAPGSELEPQGTTRLVGNVINQVQTRSNELVPNGTD